MLLLLITKLPAIATSSASGNRVAQAVSSFDLVVASKFGGTPTFPDSYILALQEVELDDILSKIKNKAQGVIDSGTSSATVELPQRSRPYLKDPASSTVHSYNPRNDAESVYGGIPS